MSADGRPLREEIEIFFAERFGDPSLFDKLARDIWQAELRAAALDDLDAHLLRSDYPDVTLEDVERRASTRLAAALGDLLLAELEDDA